MYYQQFLRLDGKNVGARAKWQETMKQELPLPKTIEVSARYGQLLNALEVQVDVWYLRRSGVNLDQVRVWVESAQNPGRHYAEKELTYFQKDLALWKFAMPPDLPFGKYLVKAQALGMDGMTISEAQSEFERLNLKDPKVNKPYQAREGRILDWIGTRCGVAEKVPPPWTPVRGDAQKGLQILHRLITLNQSGLPAQIISAEEPLLAGPIRYVAIADGKALEFKPMDKPLQVEIGQNGLTATWRGHVSNDAMALTTAASLEYDGLIHYQLNIDCPRPVKLDALYLDMPIQLKLADFVHIPPSYSALPVRQGVVWKSKDYVDNELMNTLVSHVWIGNWKCGLAFVADNTKGWYEIMGESLQTISRDVDAARLRVYFVQGPQYVSSTSLTFALMATPTSQRSEGWRLYPRADEKRHYFWLMDWFDDRKYETVNGGLAWNWDDIPKSQLDQFKDQNRTNNPQLGLPYTNPWFHYPAVMPWALKNLSPVEPIMLEEWANMPSRWGFVRPVASYRDYMTFNYDFYFRAKRYAGFYIDEAYGAEREDINMINDSGWLDRQGNLRGSYHSLDVRELFKRQYVISLQYSPIGKPFMLNHTSWGESPQYTSHVTCGVLVENLPIGPGQSYLDHMPLTTLQFWSGRAWGRFSNVAYLGPDAAAQRYCSGQLMLHDVTGPYPPWGEKDPSQPVKEKFGLYENDVQFYGYWEEPRLVASSEEQIKVSVYQRPGKALLVVCNVNGKKERQADLTIDAKSLGLPEAFSVSDIESETAVPLAQNKVTVKLPPYEVRYLIVQ
mgnify:CR=1 FL=1